jgi:hypothetical protein
LGGVRIRNGEAEQEIISENGGGHFVRRSRRMSIAPLVPARVLECFGICDAILSMAATASGGDRRLERFCVALPGRGVQLTPVWSMTLAVGAGLVVAALVPLCGLLNL